MANIDQNTLTFDVESSLLQELGERLVARIEVALTELIKNAYDADAGRCSVNWTDTNKIIIHDDGHGMTLEEFQNYWMKIATSHKQSKQKSRFYGRKVSGSKGLGRFSARFLGNKLRVETIAKYVDGTYKKLVVWFNWNHLDQFDSLKNINIPYKLYTYYLDHKGQKQFYSEKDQGTKITITKLRHNQEYINLKEIRTILLGITSPYPELKPKDSSDLSMYFGIHRDFHNYQKDPGFSTKLQGKLHEENSENEEVLSSSVLQNFVWRLLLKLNGEKLFIQLEHKLYDKETDQYIHEKKFSKTYTFPNAINSTVYADIRFFPLRKGTFSGLGLDGRKARTWLKDNKSIAIFDHGFRISPYGEEDDDWLALDADRAHSSRHWRSKLMQSNFPMTQEQKQATHLNPMLYIPTTNQLIGAVYVNSKSNGDTNTLQPSTDRMGYLKNKGFEDLQEIIRFGMELLALHDKERDLELKEKEIAAIKVQTAEEIDFAIETIKNSRSMAMEDKQHILSVYNYLSKNIDDIDDYNRKSRESLQAMSLLGVVAAFMTHEYEGTLYELDNIIRELEQLSPKTPQIENSLNKVREYNKNFKGYMKYTTHFVHNINQIETPNPYPVLPRIKYILQTFQQFRNERNIQVDISEIPKDLIAPRIPVAMYDGFIHNLYSNALKALINYPSANKIIKFLAWNEPKKHIIQVLDTGPGIPEKLQARIWDPLFTTTSASDNPLGSGMGLGLPMVKKTLEALNGSISIEKAPSGFSTCFKIQIPMNQD